MIYTITSNRNKFLEIKNILRAEINLEQLIINLPEIQSLDAEEIIREKLSAASIIHQGPFIVEDTSLYLECMNGMPGPLIKWFLKTIGNDGIYKIAESYGNFMAEARTVIGYFDKGKINFFEGTLKGRIVKPTGPTSFGWDPIFVPEGCTKSFQQMTREEKNEISMRKNAVDKLKEYLHDST